MINLPVIFRACLFSVVLAGLGGVLAYGEDQVKALRYSDETVVKILGHPPQLKGSLKDLVQANRIVFDKMPFDVDVFFPNLRRDHPVVDVIEASHFLKKIGLEPQPLEVIEWQNINGCTVVRARLSPSYELLLELGYGTKGKYFPSSAAILPHKPNFQVGWKLTFNNLWDTIIF